jgi:hypothetical protein
MLIDSVRRVRLLTAYYWGSLEGDPSTPWTSGALLADFPESGDVEDDDLGAWRERMARVCPLCGARAIDDHGRCAKCGALKRRDGEPDGSTGTGPVVIATLSRSYGEFGAIQSPGARFLHDFRDGRSSQELRRGNPAASGPACRIPFTSGVLLPGKKRWSWFPSPGRAGPNFHRLRAGTPRHTSN